MEILFVMSPTTTFLGIEKPCKNCIQEITSVPDDCFPKQKGDYGICQEALEDLKTVSSLLEQIRMEVNSLLIQLIILLISKLFSQI